jgi:hypothetical protein
MPNSKARPCAVMLAALIVFPLCCGGIIYLGAHLPSGSAPATSPPPTSTFAT